MLEHMPPALKSWYPGFLDFKYTADILQMVRKIKNRDLRELAEALLPSQDQQRRLRVERRDQRTPKGLALEILTVDDTIERQRKYDSIKRQFPKIIEDIKAILSQHRAGRELRL